MSTGLVGRLNYTLDRFVVAIQYVGVDLLMKLTVRSTNKLVQGLHDCISDKTWQIEA